MSGTRAAPPSSASASEGAALLLLSEAELEADEDLLVLEADEDLLVLEAELADIELEADLAEEDVLAELEEAFLEEEAFLQQGYGSSSSSSSASSSSVYLSSSYAFEADDSSSLGLTPYFDPFFSMFGAFSSSQLPSLVVMQVNTATDSSSVAALEQRIEQLEQSNLLLASDFTSNAEAFWDVCTTDVLGLCDVDALQQLPCLPSQTAMATKCLAANFASVQFRDCQVGVERMTTWYQVHEADVSPSAASAGAGRAGTSADMAGAGYYNFQYYDALDNVFTFFCCFLLFIFFLRCCAGCVALRRRAVLRRVELARRAEEQARKAKSQVACEERGEAGVVLGVAVTPPRKLAEPQAAKGEDDGVYYL